MPRFLYGRPSIAQKPDKDAFALTVALRSIPKRAELQINFGNLWVKPLVNKEMLAFNFTEKGLYSRRFAWKKLNFLMELFSANSPRLKNLHY